MRILHTSDWHLGRNLEGRDRHKEQEEFIDEICQIVKDEKIDLVLIAGDIFDTYNPPALSEMLFCDALDRLAEGGKRAVMVIAGNHDNPDRLCSILPLAVHQGIFIAGYPTYELKPYQKDGRASCVASGPGWIEVNIPTCPHNAVIMTLAYPSEARLKEVLSNIADEQIFQSNYSDRVKELLHYNAQYYKKNTVNLMISHLLTLGGTPSESERFIGGAYLVEGSAFPKEIQYAALGHLHRPQRIGNDDIPIYYSGSPLAYSFSEADQSKSVYIIDVMPGEKAQVKSLYLSSGKPLIKWKAIGGLNQVLKWCEEKKNFNAWIDVEVHLTESLSHSQVASIKKAHPGILNIKPIFSGEESIQRTFDRSNIPIDEVFIQFYKKKSAGAEPSEELIQLFLELLNEDSESSNEQVEEVVS